MDGKSTTVSMKYKKIVKNDHLSDNQAKLSINSTPGRNSCVAFRVQRVSITAYLNYAVVLLQLQFWSR